VIWAGISEAETADRFAANRVLLWREASGVWLSSLIRRSRSRIVAVVNSAGSTSSMSTTDIPKNRTVPDRGSVEAWRYGPATRVTETERIYDVANPSLYGGVYGNLIQQVVEGGLADTSDNRTLEYGLQQQRNDPWKCDEPRRRHLSSRSPGGCWIAGQDWPGVVEDLVGYVWCEGSMSDDQA
jgi:hypothetical protein